MKMKGMLLSSFAVLIMAVANAGAGINCLGILYQPKFPRKANDYKCNN